jgi:hypothetical protein
LGANIQNRPAEAGTPTSFNFNPLFGAAEGDNLGPFGLVSRLRFPGIAGSPAPAGFVRRRGVFGAHRRTGFPVIFRPKCRFCRGHIQFNPDKHARRIFGPCPAAAGQLCFNNKPFYCSLASFRDWQHSEIAHRI